MSLRNQPDLTKRQRGRPTSFDRETLVDAVMELFWEHGYKNLSFNEIAEASGLTRASLYNTFGTKEALFMEAIQHYVAKGQAVGPVFFKMLNEAAAFFAKDKKIEVV